LRQRLIDVISSKFLEFVNGLHVLHANGCIAVNMANGSTPQDRGLTTANRDDSSQNSNMLQAYRTRLFAKNHTFALIGAGRGRCACRS
jgi:hypothetical protein